MSAILTFREFLTACGKVRSRPKITCSDGFKMSVQGNEMAYSIPKKTGTEFDAMEIGFPSEQEDLILEFAQNPSDPTGTIYGFIPIDLIELIIEKHGGIDAECTFKDF